MEKSFPDCLPQRIRRPVHFQRSRLARHRRAAVLRLDAELSRHGRAANLRRICVPAEQRTDPLEVLHHRQGGALERRRVPIDHQRGRQPGAGGNRGGRGPIRRSGSDVPHPRAIGRVAQQIIGLRTCTMTACLRATPRPQMSSKRTSWQLQRI